MDKEDAKEKLGEAKAKAQAAWSEIKDNFKTDDGATGLRKVTSRFVNLWKSGMTGRVALIASSVVVLLLLISVFCGGGGSDKKSAVASGGGAEGASGGGTEVASGGGAGGESRAGTSAPVAKRPVPTDTLVVKGLYMGMPGDDAVEACKELVATSEDLVVVDFRNGIEREKDEATKAAEKKAYEENVKRAEADVDRVLQWQVWNNNYTYDPAQKQCLGKCDDEVSLRVNSGKEVSSDPKCISTRVFATLMAGLAGVYGYQAEWMIPGKCKNAAQKETHGPKFFPMGKFLVSDKGWDNIAKYWNANVRASANTNLYEKGLKVAKNFENRAFFRLVLQDVNGNPVEKRKLATELVLSRSCEHIFKDLSSNQEKLALAEKEVDAFLHWVEVGYDSSRSENYVKMPSDVKAEFASAKERGAMEEKMKKDPAAMKEMMRKQGEKEMKRRASAGKKHADSKLLEAALKRKDYSAAGNFSSAMADLSRKCKVMVEWAVFAEPSDKITTITKTFVVPANDFKGAYSFVSKMNEEIGEDTLKRLFFEKELDGLNSPVWFRLVLKNTNGVEVAKEEIVKNWLTNQGHHPPSDKVILPKKNLIQISIKKAGVREDELQGLVFVWIDDAGKVKQVYFNGDGMDKFFGELSGNEFAQALVNNYSEIPNLKPERLRDSLKQYGSIETTTWIYTDSKGYQVKLFECAFVAANGKRFNSDKNLNAEVSLSLSMAGKGPKKYFVISAIKPESVKKFD